MKIYINVVQGGRITISIKGTDSVDHLRKLISTRLETHYEHIHLFLNKTRLSEARTLQSYGIVDKSELIAYVHKIEKEYEGPILDGNFNFSSRAGQEAIKNGYIMPFKAFDPEKYSKDPPDFEQKVDYLAAIGYPRKDCKSALRACYYDLCDSMQMLNGQVHPDYAYMYKEEEEEMDEKPSKSKRAKNTKKRKSSVTKKDPKNEEKVTKDKDAFESSSSSQSAVEEIIPASNTTKIVKQLDKKIDSLTKNDKINITKLCNTSGCTRDEAVQYYLACNRDYLKALKAMSNK